jgi:hypothetical protein
MYVCLVILCVCFLLENVIDMLYSVWYLLEFYLSYTAKKCLEVFSLTSKVFWKFLYGEVCLRDSHILHPLVCGKCSLLLSSHNVWVWTWGVINSLAVYTH